MACSWNRSVARRKLRMRRALKRKGLVKKIHGTPIPVQGTALNEAGRIRAGGDFSPAACECVQLPVYLAQFPARDLIFGVHIAAPHVFTAGGTAPKTVCQRTSEPLSGSPVQLFY